MLELSLPKVNFSIKKIQGKIKIFDIVRKKYVTLTPEEWVRQTFIHFLINQKNISANFISIESGLKYNRLKKRSDILVLNNSLKPYLLIECKAPDIEINDKVIEQLSIYNSTIDAEIIGISNGIIHYFWQKLNDSEYTRIQDLPELM